MVLVTPFSNGQAPGVWVAGLYANELEKIQNRVAVLNLFSRCSQLRARPTSVGRARPPGPYARWHEGT